jgi:hypothetical protein
MAMAIYPPPVDKLLAYGEIKSIRRKWTNYPEQFELRPEHIPDLIRMATDSELNGADSDNPEVWAPIHALRALAQLKAEEAIAPLLSVFDEMEEDEWFREEVSEVFGMIGAAANELPRRKRTGYQNQKRASCSSLCNWR